MLIFRKLSKTGPNNREVLIQRPKPIGYSIFNENKKLFLLLDLGQSEAITLPLKILSFLEMKQACVLLLVGSLRKR